MHKPTTPRLDKLMVFLREFFADNDQLPTMGVIRAKFGWTSSNAASDALYQLEKRNLIERNAVGKYRFARTTQQLENSNAIHQA